MQKLLLIPALLLIISCTQNTMKLDYPETRKDNVVDTFYGIPVEDPYRWLEDDNSEETAAWVKAQNEVTFGYLETLPYRDKINQRLTELWNYPKAGTPFSIAGHWFVFKNDGLQNQNILFLLEGVNGEAKELLDPNKLSDDGTVAFSGMDVTPDGKLLVYKIARSGSDWNEIFVMNIETGQLLDDHIEWVKFSGLSCIQGGFFYSAYDVVEEGKELSNAVSGQKIYYHKIGTSQENDELIYSNSDMPNRMYTASVDDNKKYLFIMESESTSGNGLYIKPLDGDGSVVQIAEGFEFDYLPIEIVGTTLLLHINEGAPKYKVVAVDLLNPAKENWTNIIPESENTLQSVSFCGGQLFAEYMVDAKSKIEKYTSAGEKIGEVKLPGICSVGAFRGTYHGLLAFYSYSSFNTPGTVFKYDIETGESSEYFRPEVKFNPDDIVVKQEFCTSNDGTKVPMFIVHKKGVKLDGTNPTLLYAYGGFNISLTPTYSTSNIFFVENGGVYVMANLRGGGEYGEEWHNAGTKMQKQNVFDDFIAAAEYLIESGYTNAEKLAIRGGSNGGLLIGAVVNQRPELFKVAYPAVGVLDMLRYQNFTIGYAWASDYGRSDDNKEMFNYLYAYSPIHNVQEKNYPAIMVTTADHDDRVVPAHSFKYISRIQEMNMGDLPTLIRIDVKAGHGGGKPTAKIIEEYTDIFAFAFKHLGIEMN